MLAGQPEAQVVLGQQDLRHPLAQPGLMPFDPDDLRRGKARKDDVAGHAPEHRITVELGRFLCRALGSIGFLAGLAGRVAGMVNNPNKGIIDRTRNFADEKAKQFAMKRQVANLNPDGTPIPNIEEFHDAPIKTYRAVKTPAQYNEIVRVLTYWGDDSYLASADDNDPEVSEIRRFRKANENVGYNYHAHFQLLYTENSDGTPKTVLVHKKSNGIVLHMLDVFDVFLSAHNQQGHLKTERTLAALKPQY